MLHFQVQLYYHPQLGSKLGHSEILKGVKLEIGGGLETVKSSPSVRWVWLLPDGQGLMADFQQCQCVKHKNLTGQDLDRSHRWKYGCLHICSVPPLIIINGIDKGSLAWTLPHVHATVNQL